MRKNKLTKILNNNINTVIKYTDINNNYILCKENFNKNMVNKEFIIENNKIIEKVYKYLNVFSDTLNTKLKHCNFKNLNNNIKTAIILEKKFSVSKYYCCASYLTKKNRIVLYNKNIEENIYHELLHLASTKKINDNLFMSGFTFSDYKNKLKIGSFLDEGYTEYLCSKYFIGGNTYLTQIDFVKVVELIVGKKLMEKMYFNADIVGLINELTKYGNTREEVLEFIINTDIIHLYRFSKSPFKRIKLKKCTISVNNFLVKTYYNKLLQKGIKPKYINMGLNLFVNSLMNIFIGNEFNYNYMNEANEFYRKIYENEDNIIKEKKLNQ